MHIKFQKYAHIYVNIIELKQKKSVGIKCTQIIFLISL